MGLKNYITKEIKEKKYNAKAAKSTFLLHTKLPNTCQKTKALQN